MDKQNYKPRVIDAKVKEYLSAFGAVCIEGPKWCGKTWTSSQHSKSEIYIGDPANNFQNRQLAELSPALILDGETPRLIDEWQEVPPIWDAVRYKVDQVAEKGQFILTGSATPNHKGILHSGAGRIAKLRMRPMSLYESGDSCGKVSLEKLCHGELAPALTGEVDLKKLIELIIRGGWPGSLGLPIEQAANTDDDKAKLKNFGCTHEQPPFRKIRGQEVTPGNGGQTAAVNWQRHGEHIIKNDKMQLFTLFRSQNKGLISTPIFTPNSFYNSLPYFTEKPANP